MTPQVSLLAGRGSIVLTTLILAWTVAMQPSPARGQDPPPTPTPVADGADDQGAPGGGQAASQDPQVLTSRSGSRGVRVAGGPRPGSRTGRSQRSAGAHPGDATRPETGWPEYPVDSGLLGLGRLAQRLHLDQRHLGVERLRTASGSRATGTRSTTDTSGCQEPGFPFQPIMVRTKPRTGTGTRD